MPLILPGNVASATAPTAYSIDNSCRFNQDASLNKAATSTAATLATKSTISFWIKMCSFGVSPSQNVCYTAGGTPPYFQIQWPGNTGSGPVPFIQSYVTAGNHTQLYGNQLIRDTAAWYHVVFSYDSTPSTPSSSSMRLFINGTQVTSLQTDDYPNQNVASPMTTASQNWYIGSNANGSAVFFDGYLAEFMVVDGQALAATDFGEFDEDSPTIWKPIDISDITLGAQGFYLDFKDSANMGNDVGGGTDFTENSIDATDQCQDSPTNNFCTMNALDNFHQANVFSQGNNKVVTNTTYYSASNATIGLTAGKWYWEVKPTYSGGSPSIGINGQMINGHYIWTGYLTDSYGYKGSDGKSYHADTGSTYGDAYSTTNIIGVALNLDDNELTFYVNNSVQNSGTAISITAAASTTQEAYFPAFSDTDGNAGTFEANFGGSSAFTVSSAASDENGYGAFEYAPPSGFLAICTKNLGSDGG